LFDYSFALNWKDKIAYALENPKSTTLLSANYETGKVLPSMDVSSCSHLPSLQGHSNATLPSSGVRNVFRVGAIYSLVALAKRDIGYDAFEMIEKSPSRYKKKNS
jgi:hypothetical protein